MGHETRYSFSAALKLRYSELHLFVSAVGSHMNEPVVYLLMTSSVVVLVPEQVKSRVLRVVAHWLAAVKWSNMANGEVLCPVNCSSLKKKNRVFFQSL